MTRALLPIVLVVLLSTVVLCGAPSPAPVEGLQLALLPLPGRVTLSERGTTVESPSILRKDGAFVWGGSVARLEDGRYAMFCSVFDSGPEEVPFVDAWLLRSKIAWAVSDRRDGGFVLQGVLLEGAAAEGRPGAWDAHMVHNPHIRIFGGRPYLYYVGSRDPGPQPDGMPGAKLSRRARIQQLQRIGVITAASLNELVAGRFVRPAAPLLVPRTRVKGDDVLYPSPPGTAPLPDNLVTVNPSVAYRPADGRYLLYFKGNVYDPGWRGVHGVAVGDTPTGPFQAQDAFVLDVVLRDGKRASAEDPYVWFHPGTGLFHAVLKDFSGWITRRGPGLALMTSRDGVTWRPARQPLFSSKELVLQDGTRVPLARMERPQLLVDEQGDPVAFYAACAVEPVNSRKEGGSFNVQLGVQEIAEEDAP